MKLEPEVIEKINAEKRRVLLQKISVIACFIPGLLLYLGLLLAVFFTRQTNIDHEKITVLKWVTVAVVPCVLFLTILQYLQIKVTFNNFLRKQDPLRLTTILDNSQLSFQRFKNGIEGVSIAVGLQTRPLVVLDIPEMSSVSFKSYDKLSTVGVTQSALDADLSDQEAEAVMAHEISHIVIGDILKPPNYFSIVTLFIALPILMLPVFFSLLTAFSGNQNAGGIAMIILFLSNLVLVPLAFYLFRKRYKLLDRHEDILADSIACKITSNPQALLTAIDKLAEKDLLGRMPIGQSMLAFVWSPSEYVQQWRQESPLFRMDKAPTIDRGRMPIVVPTLKEKDAIEERRLNLLEIQKEHWQAFETVGDGRVRQEADSWE